MGLVNCEEQCPPRHVLSLEDLPDEFAGLDHFGRDKNDLIGASNDVLDVGMRTKNMFGT